MSKMQSNFVTSDTSPPSGILLPHFVISAPISSTAKLIYCCILDAVTASLLEDDYGHHFAVFPIADIVAVVGKSDMTVKRALWELEAAGLLKRDRPRIGAPNHLYALLRETV